MLIFKASGVFNFAQGAMVLFAALSVARMAEVMPLWLAALLGVGVMVLLAIVIERLVLRPLVNQEGVVLLMATLGVSYFLDGFGQSGWGSDIYAINLGLAKAPEAEIEIRWPSGQTDKYSHVVANQFYLAREGDGLRPDPYVRARPRSP